MINCKWNLTVFLLLLIVHARSQDSLRVSLDDADKRFMQKNLMLAAGQLNVDAQKALEIQARLYPNPQFLVGVDMYDGDNKKAFYAGSKGEKSFEFDQLILLGGKRKNQIELARQSSVQAGLELEDLLRNLKFQLHNSLFSLHFDMLTLQKYNLQLQQLDTIILAYEVQTKKGNLPLKEVVRLKSLYIRLNNDKTDLLHSIQQEQKDIQVILHATEFIIPAIEELPDKKFEQLLPLDSLENLAVRNRTDLKISNLNKTIAGLNLRYQKSMSVPDLTLGSSYDQRGNAFNKQFMMTVGIPLPLWNRNQGNISFAKTQTKLAAVNQQMQEEVVISDVKAAWYNMQRSVQEYQKSLQVYNTDFSDVYQGMLTNFIKRNISIMEFVDFFESYNESIAEINRIRKQLALSAENLNYTVAYPVY